MIHITRWNTLRVSLSFLQITKNTNILLRQNVAGPERTMSAIIHQLGDLRSPFLSFITTTVLPDSDCLDQLLSEQKQQPWRVLSLQSKSPETLERRDWNSLNNSVKCPLSDVTWVCWLSLLQLKDSISLCTFV